MRALFLMLATLLAMPAMAKSKMVLTSDRAIIVLVNGLPRTMTAGGRTTFEFPDGKEGFQYIKVNSVLGELRHEGKVEVPRGMVVRVSWKGRMLRVESSERIGNPARPSQRKHDLYRMGSRKPPIPPPSEGLPLHDIYLLAVRDARDLESRTGQKIGYPGQ